MCLLNNVKEIVHEYKCPLNRPRNYSQKPWGQGQRFVGSVRCPSRNYLQFQGWLVGNKQAAGSLDKLESKAKLLGPNRARDWRAWLGQCQIARLLGFWGSSTVSASQRLSGTFYFQTGSIECLIHYISFHFMWSRRSFWMWNWMQNPITLWFTK